MIRILFSIVTTFVGGTTCAVAMTVTVSILNGDRHGYLLGL
jgi:hypothetical protein